MNFLVLYNELISADIIFVKDINIRTVIIIITYLVKVIGCKL